MQDASQHHLALAIRRGNCAVVMIHVSQNKRADSWNGPACVSAICPFWGKYITKGSHAVSMQKPLGLDVDSSQPALSFRPASRPASSVAVFASSVQDFGDLPKLESLKVWEIDTKAAPMKEVRWMVFGAERSWCPCQDESCVLGSKKTPRFGCLRPTHTLVTIQMKLPSNRGLACSQHVF